MKTATNLTHAAIVISDTIEKKSAKYHLSYGDTGHADWNEEYSVYLDEPTYNESPY